MTTASISFGPSPASAIARFGSPGASAVHGTGSAERACPGRLLNTSQRVDASRRASMPLSAATPCARSGASVHPGAEPLGVLEPASIQPWYSARPGWPYRCLECTWSRLDDEHASTLSSRGRRVCAVRTCRPWPRRRLEASVCAPPYRPASPTVCSAQLRQATPARPHSSRSNPMNIITHDGNCSRRAPPGRDGMHQRVGCRDAG